LYRLVITSLLREFGKSLNRILGSKQLDYSSLANEGEIKEPKNKPKTFLMLINDGQLSLKLLEC